MPSEKPRPLPILVHGIQYQGRIWHIKMGPLVLRPEFQTTLKCEVLGMQGVGIDAEAARHDFGREFAAAWDRVMDPKRKRNKESDALREKLLHYVGEVADHRAEMAADAKIIGDRIIKA